MTTSSDSPADETDLQRSLDQPNAARVYDYLLGGANNFAPDRAYAKEMIARTPSVVDAVMANRRFLRRVLTFAVGRGIRQFLDIGSGLPGAGAVHEICERLAPGECRVVYVDNDPIASTHGQRMLEQNADTARHTVRREDFHRPDAVLDAARSHLDLGQPVCLITLALLHFVDEPLPALDRYHAVLAPRSVQVVSHAFDEAQDSAFHETVDAYRRTNAQMRLRSRGDIRALFGGWELVEPGLVWLSEWRPEDGEAEPDEPRLTRGLCGVAVKPGA